MASSETHSYTPALWNIEHKKFSIHNIFPIIYFSFPLLLSTLIRKNIKKPLWIWERKLWLKSTTDCVQTIFASNIHIMHKVVMKFSYFHNYSSSLFSEYDVQWAARFYRLFIGLCATLLLLCCPKSMMTEYSIKFSISDMTLKRYSQESLKLLKNFFARRQISSSEGLCTLNLILLHY